MKHRPTPAVLPAGKTPEDRLEDLLEEFMRFDDILMAAQNDLIRSLRKQRRELMVEFIRQASKAGQADT